jgi:hypothetical protein
MKARTGYIISAIGALLLALVFFWWAIQTAWLGSFPGRDTEQYAFWAYTQLAAAILFLVIAAIAFLKARKARTRPPS